MSQINEEPSPEEPDEINSSENSSGSTCSVTVTTNSHSGSGSNSNSSSDGGSSSSSDRSTGNSDSDNDLDNSHKHRHCHLSEGHLTVNPDSLDTTNTTTPSEIEDKNDDKVIDGKQSGTGHKCDSRAQTGCSATKITSDPKATTTNTHIESPPPSRSPPYPSQSAQQRTQEVIKQKLNESKVAPNRLSFADEQIIQKNYQYECGRQKNLTANTTSLGSSYSNLSSTTSTNGPTTASSTSSSRRILKPAPTPSTMTPPSESPSLSALDTNNNKNHDNISSTSRDGLSSKRTNFSKSASGSRLVNRSRPSAACDCLSQDCGEKKHSNRRQFIEHYYNCRAQLSSVDTSISSFNISTPLNRLNECDAITKRLLSSPIRTSNVVESPVRGVQMSDADKSRRASLGATTLTDHVLLYASNPFKSLESSYRRSYQDKQKSDNQRKCDVESGENDVKSKQQQQGRSLSVCDEETLNPRLRNNSSNHSSNLNRAISLACESGSTSSTRRALTLIPLFGCDIKSLEQFTSSGLILPPVIDSAVNHILANGINSIGIFRKSGVKTRILTLRQRIEANQFVKMDELNQNNEFSIYDIADLVKMWFRELKPVPLMSKDLIRIISSFLNTTTGVSHQSKTILKRGNSSQQQQKESSNIRSNISSSDNVDPFLRSRIDAITTPTHRALLLRALNFLAQISARCEVNQMTSQNLAICLTPSLCETESDQNSILVDQKALEYCIDNHRMLFGKPNIKS